MAVSQSVSQSLTRERGSGGRQQPDHALLLAQNHQNEAGGGGMATAAAAELQLFLSIKFSLVRSVGGSLAAFPPCRLPAMMSYLPTPTSFYRATIPLPPPFGVVRPAARESRSFLELALLLNEIPAAFHPTLLPERERKKESLLLCTRIYVYVHFVLLSL